MTGLLVFLVLLLIVMQSRLLQDLLGMVVLAFVAAAAYGYFLSSTAERPAAEPVIHQAPAPTPPPMASSPAPSPGQTGHYNFDPQPQGPPRPPRPYRQQ